MKLSLLASIVLSCLLFSLLQRPTLAEMKAFGRNRRALVMKGLDRFPQSGTFSVRAMSVATAITKDLDKKPMLDSTFKKATPFSYGAGHIRPNRAMDPGLVYDLTIIDYLNVLCSLGYNQSQLQMFSKSYKCPKEASSLKDLNYPGEYKARFKALTGITVTVKADVLRFEKTGEEKRFVVQLKGNGIEVAKDYVFGVLIWSDGKHNVRSPIVVKSS